MLSILTKIKDTFQDFYEQPYRQAEALIALDRLICPRLPLPSMGKWAIAPDFALLLARTVQERIPKTIVELGSGVSTLVFSYVLEAQTQGQIISIDHESQFLKQTQNTLASHGLGSRVRWVHAPLVSIEVGRERFSWYDLPKDLPETIDLLLIDGPPGKLQRLSRYPAVPKLISRLKKNSMIIVDDANRRDERKMVKRWLGEYPELEATFLPLYKGAYRILHR